jgi:CHAT domain-containing protein
MSKGTQFAPCPDPESLGAYVESSLDDRAMIEITAHIATCNDCLDAVSGALRFQREERSAPVEMRSGRQHRRIWIAAAASILAIVGLASLRGLLRRDPDSSALKQLAAAAPQDYRLVEPRLTGFAWAPLRNFREDGGHSFSTADPAYLKLAGVAGEVIRHGEDASRDAAHAAGVAKLLLRDPSDAVRRLEIASRQSPGDADVWSDLAAARLDRALQEKRPAALPLALDAADRALKLVPSLATARFNRALILESIGLREEAATAWRAYLEIDSSSGWAENARQHLKKLEAAPTALPFRDRVGSIESAAMANDSANVARLVDPYRQDARAWFEVEELGLWGKALLEGNEQEAARKLTAARQVGDVLASSRGESLLHDTVRAIDSAPSASVVLLARAHVRYREARLAYRDRHLIDAASGLTEAARQFRSLGSPMEGPAQFYNANTVFDRNRIGEAQTLLERMLDHGALRSSHYRALEAQVQQQLGLWYGYSGRWTDALAAFTHARETFEALGEFGNLAAIESKLAESYDLLAQRNLAWQHRVTAFELFSEHPFGDRLLVTLSGAVRAEAHDGHDGAALSLLTLELAEARRSRQPILLADALRRRALLFTRTGEQAAAWQNLREAQTIADTADPSIRARLGAENQVAEAVLSRATDPRRAINLLTASIDFFRQAGQHFALPDALLERALAQRAVRANEAAWRDLDDGIAELESQRAASGAELRATIFDEGAGLFEEVVDLLVTQGEGERALAYSERARARTLLEGRSRANAPIVASSASVSHALPPGTVLVEWMLARRSIVAFVISPSGLDVVRLPTERSKVEAQVHTVRAAIEERRTLESVHREAAALDVMLLAPIRSAVGEKTESIIMVPDRFLEAVPWAALCAGAEGPWLIQQSALVIAPSASVWVHDIHRFNAPLASPRLLVVSSNGGGDTEVLRQADAEARSVASFYRNAQSLTDGAATKQRFLADCPRYDVIHFCGHAQAESSGAALLFANAGASGSGRLSAHDISGQHLDRARLIVLAACATARGDDERLEGIPTLARAFLNSGATSVAAALWRIEDEESAALSVELHRALRRSGNPAQALREAQRFMLASDRADWRHPAAWAGIELLGSSPPI